MAEITASGKDAVSLEVRSSAIGDFFPDNGVFGGVLELGANLDVLIFGPVIQCKAPPFS